jgi:hypothetical protein
MPLVKLWQLLEHKKTIDDHDDVSIVNPTDGQVLTYEAATALWKNKAPPAAGGDPDALITYILAGTVKVIYAEENLQWSVCFPDTYADLAVQTYVAVLDYYTQYLLTGRKTDINNFYFNWLYQGATTGDHGLSKIVAGTGTSLATEAVDVYNYRIRTMKLSCSGTTISSYRADLVTPKLSVTDTSLASGYFGPGVYNQYYHAAVSPEYYILARKTVASSPAPQPIAYFEVPIIGDGSLDNPFRAQMPELIVEDPLLGKRNLLALSHSSLIPTDRATGRPIHGTALVRIFAQPDRDPKLYPITKCLDALRAMSGVTELTREMAIKRAKQMDDKLCDYDLLVFDKPTKAQIREYIEWRKSTFNVEMSEADAERYLKSDKGW